jgi:ATP-dependent DNA helicase RecG
LRFADLEHDSDLVEMARDVAEELIRAGSPAVTKHLERWLGSKQFHLKA